MKSSGSQGPKNQLDSWYSKEEVTGYSLRVLPSSAMISCPIILLPS